MRHMKNEWDGHLFYESSFDERTGALARVVEVPEPVEDTSRWADAPTFLPHLADWLKKDFKKQWNSEAQKLWGESFGRRDGFAFSPSPETLDIQITNWCNFGCPMCYQDSTPKGQHADPELVLDVLRAFDQLPYQVAFGGGEPTYHPFFRQVMRETRELGVVPNYTTAGQVFHPSSRNLPHVAPVIEATNDYCGGVALTYHEWKSTQYFMETLKSMKELLKVQLNIHVIANKNVVKALKDLIWVANELKTGPLNIVLLAYHPIGRGSWQDVMPKEVYSKDLPNVLAEVVEAKHRLAFSEGLMPYFLSRPELPMVTAFAEASEGAYSAYVDLRGRMSMSSFEPPISPAEEAKREESYHDPVPSLLKGNLQEGWTKGWVGTSKIGRWSEQNECRSCDLRDRCGVTHLVDFMQCARASHN